MIDFIHSTKYLLINIQSTSLGARDTTVNKTDKFSALKRLVFWWDLNPGQYHSKVLFFLLNCDTKGFHKIKNTEMVGKKRF